MCKEQEIVNIICKYFRTGKEINSAQKAAKEIKALIEQENAAMRDALVTARGIAMEQEEDWIAVERTYLPERIIPFRDIQVVLDAVLGGSHE